MSGSEIRAHATKKWAQCVDGFTHGPGVSPVGPPQPSRFPSLPPKTDFPETALPLLAEERDRLLAGQWTAFGHIPLRVELPPRWHKDYLAGIDLQSDRSAFRLNHRNLPGRADIKLVWELSRWSTLVRFCQAAWLLEDKAAGEMALRCLEDWDRHNPPYRGWNWTSALESGIRLMQWTWMERCLAASGLPGDRIQALADRLLPSHLAFTWRHRSFGSSANNHLLGELAGLIVALCARPALERFAAPIDTLQQLWETEVLAQFAADGGNREQALNYQLFSFEFCWQVRQALRASGRPVGAAVEERLSRAVDFFVTVQVEREPWDYGDSDSAWVTPVFGSEATMLSEWLGWMNGSPSGAAIQFWLGPPPKQCESPACVATGAGGLHFRESGVVLWLEDPWTLRWDLTELGYLATAAHGHLDALHLSIWMDGLALVVDPGTGAYYGDRRLRSHLASWAAHNGPTPAGLSFPKRSGPFLWSEKHERPEIQRVEADAVMARLQLPTGVVERTITRLTDEPGWRVDDNYTPADARAESAFVVFWQFAPGWTATRLHTRMFRLTKGSVAVEVGLDAAWKNVELILPSSETASFFAEGDLTGICSQKFRETRRAPALRLEARGHNPCLFRTTFLASRAA